ncbi:MAG: nicotinate-nucleotide--dimethylbenzimidazole phosphoribosyltransferase [Acidobacteriota bacterium]
MEENFKQQIEETCQQVRYIDKHWLTQSQSRQLVLTKPPGSLGKLEDTGNRIAAINEMVLPQHMLKRIYVVAADHGITAEGVSAYPKEVTYQMVFNFLRGGAAINVLARHGDIEVQVVDAGVDYQFLPGTDLLNRKVVLGTRNFAKESAMTRTQAEHCIAIGIELAQSAKRDGISLLGIGDMGIGNTTSASAITTVLTQSEAKIVTGLGTGINDMTFLRKVSIIEQAIKLHNPDKDDPIDILSKVGGAEIGVMMGIVIGAAAERIAIVADGFISTAAAALAVAKCPQVGNYLFIAHLSCEPGHQALIKYIGLNPLLDLGLRLGEGTGAALAMHMIEASAKLLTEMATFDEAGVSNKE